MRDVRPRFKLRTRCYVTTRDCFFEVKVKDEDGETSKRNIDYDPDERGEVVPDAHKLVRGVLGEHGLDEPENPRPSLVTAFRRVTIVAGDRPERTTFDFDVGLRDPDGDSIRLDAGYAVAETKTAEGDGAWDRALAEAGFESISLNKYRVGTGILRAPEEDREYTRDVKRLLRPTAGRLAEGRPWTQASRSNESESEADRFQPPPWFGSELTHDPRYSTQRLATDGRPRA